MAIFCSTSSRRRPAKRPSFPQYKRHADPLVLENALRRRGEAFKTLTPEEVEALVDALVDEYVAEKTCPA